MVNALLLHKFSNKVTVTMVVEINSVTFWITSSYLAHEYGLSSSQEPIGRLVAYAKLREVPGINGADTNSHHTMCSSSGASERGSTS